MILFIDTTNNDITKLALLSESRVVQDEWKSRFNQEETFLPSMEKFFKKAKVKNPDINKIAVVAGPGFFSRVRLGVVFANALALALGVKVSEAKKNSEITFDVLNSLPEKEFVHPYYDKQPNITQAKLKE